MSTTLKTQDLDENYSRLRSQLSTESTEDLQIILDAYNLIGGRFFETSIKAIKDELEFRSTSLGKELF
jgi:hypothetical protein